MPIELSKPNEMDGPTEFPSASDRLFATATEWRHDACLKHYPNDWLSYAVGYKDAADVVVADFVKGTHRRDPLVFPIVFLYRQFLELSLKYLIRQTRDYPATTDDFATTHKLDDLWRLLRGLLNQACGSGGDEMDQIERLIGEFCAVDPLSQAFRYPEYKDGNPSLPNISYINVVNMRDVVGKIALLLDCVDAAIHANQSAKNEMARWSC